MRVILAEKPSVAQSIAAVLGANQKRNGYLQGENDLVSWCIGHLIELAPPEIYDVRYAKWRREDLPIVPSAWESVVSDGTKKQFAVLKDLLNRTDVDEVVCATDAGREGELIFRMVYEKTGCTKPVKRLWKVPSAMVFGRSSRALPTTRCTVRLCAVRRRTGWWASTEHGCIPGSTEPSSMSGAS